MGRQATIISKSTKEANHLSNRIIAAPIPCNSKTQRSKARATSLRTLSPQKYSKSSMIWRTWAISNSKYLMMKIMLTTAQDRSKMKSRPSWLLVEMLANSNWSKTINRILFKDLSKSNRRKASSSNTRKEIHSKSARVAKSRDRILILGPIQVANIRRNIKSSSRRFKSALEFSSILNSFSCPIIARCLKALSTARASQITWLKSTEKWALIQDKVRRTHGHQISKQWNTKVTRWRWISSGRREAHPRKDVKLKPMQRHYTKTIDRPRRTCTRKTSLIRWLLNNQAWLRWRGPASTTHTISSLNHVNTNKDKAKAL